MDKISLLKKMLPGLLPLFVFIIADEIWGTEIGLIVAIGFGIIELIYSYVRNRTIDKFVIFDTGLLVALGGISILLENEIFFKLKPALIQCIFVAIIGFSAFSRQNILLLMSKRYMKGIKMTEAQVNQLRITLKSLFWIFVVHTILVVYSAWFLSKEAWAFISGGLFYIIFGAFFVYEFVKNKLKAKKWQNEEWLPLVDKEGNIKGKAPRSVCHSGRGYLHPVVHLHVINKNGAIFLQKRPHSKKVQPDKWDTAVGGHVGIGETINTSLMRESEEEVGLRKFEPFFVESYIWETEIESELVYTFITKTNGKLAINKMELADGRFWKVNEIKENLGKGVFTPNFEKEFEMLEKKNVFD